MQHELYRHVLARHGIVSLDVSATQEEVSSLIEAVKQGQHLDVCRERMRHVWSQYPNADSLIPGCTEISLRWINPVAHAHGLIPMSL
jgi:aspartate/glutamate racemase